MSCLWFCCDFKVCCQEKVFFNRTRVIVGFDISELERGDPNFLKGFANTYQIGLEYNYKPSLFRVKLLLTNKYYLPHQYNEGLHLVYGFVPAGLAVPLFRKRITVEAGIFVGVKIADNWKGKIHPLDYGGYFSFDYAISRAKDIALFMAYYQGSVDINSYKPHWVTQYRHNSSVAPEITNAWLVIGTKIPFRIRYTKSKANE